jgi:hypothetical protein
VDNENIIARVAEEHRKLSGIVEDLHGPVIEAPSGDRQAWLDELRHRLSRLRTHMSHRVALEEVGGFFAKVVETRPNMAGDVEHLKRENRDILASIEQVHQSLADTSPDDVERLKLVRLRIHHVLSAVRHHAEHEDMLVSFVFAEDPDEPA